MPVGGTNFVPWYAFWALIVVPLLVVFVFVGFLFRRLAPKRPHLFRRVVVVANVVFLLWTTATALHLVGVIPSSRLGPLPLIGGTFLGLVFHFAWWLIADVLLAVAWWSSGLSRRATAT